MKWLINGDNKKSWSGAMTNGASKTHMMSSELAREIHGVWTSKQVVLQLCTVYSSLDQINETQDC